MAHPSNLIDKLLKYPRVLPGVSSVTDIEEMTGRNTACAEMGLQGVYNAVQSGALDIALQATAIGIYPDFEA